MNHSRLLMSYGAPMRINLTMAGLARFVMRETIYPLLAISLLLTPDGGASDPGPPRDLRHGQSLVGMQDNIHPLNVLQMAIAMS